ncbi:LytTR family DNA-binding domain-containing protein [Oscillibacter sp.]|uniref:LytR/AlgR family response regulator transcription factor n=1 Tax=Oscillibacter sp. TaxID=1945593 RepID=UPI0028A12878|nr:LytTR family DNA-binding domain-containing protein [Oscillibacter sp.]
MLRVVLCDDNSDSVRKYAELISLIADKNQYEVVISSYESGETLLFHNEDTPGQIDILYLDILMEKADGMETARKLRDSGCKAQIVFLTSCEDYIYDAFDVNAVQYLIKDITSIEKFERVFLIAAERASVNKEELFTFEFDGEIGIIPIHQISYFEIWKRLVTVYYGNGKTAKFYGRMEQLEESLCRKGFVRAHRSYLVHLPYIAMFRHQSLLLKTGEEVPVGGTYMQPLKRAFSDYIAYFHICGSEDSYGFEDSNGMEAGR